MKYIDDFLNKITMYRVVLYGLTLLVALSLVLSLFGVLSYSWFAILESWIVLCFSCFIFNQIFSKILSVQTNVESVWITALILTLILSPISSLNSLYLYIGVSFIAMASKYVFAISKKHIFNPVAISIFIIGLFGSGASMWWVGSKAMLIPVAIVGFLILRKTRRFEMFYAFLFSSLISVSFMSFVQGFEILESLNYAFLSGPIIFFGAVMLTEPLTTPPKKALQIVYGVIVGLFYGLDFHLGSLYNTPELTLLIGNIFAYIVSPKDRLKLTLIEKINLTADTYEFVWKPNKKISYNPGQYLEWTLGHSKPDTRGNRRYFTISSSPTESEIKLGIKTYQNPSSFKQKLVSLNPGEVIFASQLSGEFILPKDLDEKMVWIAGGIGVTPFRSMAKYMVDKNENRDVVFFYSNRTPQDIVYRDVFSEGGKYGIKIVNVVNNIATNEANLGYKVGLIDETLIRSEVPDYTSRTFYISGPHGMVNAFESTLKKMGVPGSKIKVDFFPGFV